MISLHNLKCLSLGFLILALPLEAQEKDKLLENGNYAVIGAFGYFHNVEKFIPFVKEMGFDADYGYAPKKRLYYVYVKKSEDFKEVVSESTKLREYPEFNDAWAMTYEYVPETEIAEVDTREADVVAETEVAAPAIPVNDPQQESAPEVIVEKKYYVYINTTSAKTLKEVSTNVKISDIKTEKEIVEANAHEVVTLDPELVDEKILRLDCQPFGYKPIQHVVSMDKPIADSTSSFVRMEGDTMFVDFELNRYKPGDFIVMYNVYFYKDAAIMKPWSKKELDELLAMLQENDLLYVQLHGHTNGNSYGKIVEMSEEDSDFFKLRPTNVESKGSAKKLSESRAEVIQRYLIDNGISEDRIKVKGWGGKRMLYDKFHPEAESNVRVEVEILKDS